MKAKKKEKWIIRRIGFMANGKWRDKVSFGKLGIVLGILVVVVSIVWVTILSLGKDNYSGNEITWVG